MAELADALDLGSSEIFLMGVRVPPLAPESKAGWQENGQRMNMAERKFTVSVASPSQCKRVLSLDIDSEELSKEKALVISKLRGELKVPGFRQGKVPEKYIQKNYASMIHGDAVRNLLPRIFE